MFVFRDAHRPSRSGIVGKAGCGVRKHVPQLLLAGHLPATCSPKKRGQSRGDRDLAVPFCSQNNSSREASEHDDFSHCYIKVDRERDRIKQQSPVCGRPSVNASRDPAAVFSCLLTLYFLSLHLQHRLELASVLFGCHPLNRFQKHLSVFFFCCNQWLLYTWDQIFKFKPSSVSFVL